MTHLCLIDGSGYIFRAFYGLPSMTNPQGVPVNAVYGFSSMLMKLLQDMEADSFLVVFDAARKNFRNDIYPDYKANRKETPEELIPQFDLIRDAVTAFNLPQIEYEGFEADDIIATYAKLAHNRDDLTITVVTADKDLMQLINGKVSIFDPMKNKYIKKEEVFDKFGVAPNQVTDVQALIGDTSDNVPGVPSIGPKTAAQLINEFGSLDNLLNNLDKLPPSKKKDVLIENIEKARMSYELVTLSTEVPIDIDITKLKLAPPKQEDLISFVNKHGFRSLKSRLEKTLIDGFSGENNATETITVEKPKSTDYELVTNESSLKKWLKTAETNGLIAIDTETDSLDPMLANLVGVSLSTEAGKACYIPLRHNWGNKKEAPAQASLFDMPESQGADTSNKIDMPQIDFDKALSLLKSMLEDSSIIKVGHNIKYDLHVLNREYKGNLNPSSVEDTMIMSYVLDSVATRHNMDDLAELHLQHKTIKFADVCGSGKNAIGFADVVPEHALAYAAEDADITLRLYQLFSQRLVLEKAMSIYKEMDLPLMFILSEMERNGVKADEARLKHLGEEFAQKIASLQQEIYELAGEEFNIGSPKQLGEVLFDKMKIESGKKSKTGAYSTSIDVLEKLADDGVEIANKIIEWRHYSKLKSTYADALLTQINPHTKRVHTSFMQCVTSTGRLSSSDPNLQNIPIRSDEGKKIRECFIAEKGRVLISADYSQVELRLMADVAGVEGLKEAFAQDIDIHASTASQVFGVPIEGMDPMVRRQAKAINFGIIYGISAFGLAKQIDVSRSDAAEYINKYFAKFPEIKDYMSKTIEEAKTFGFITTPFGRKCFISGINDKNRMVASNAERAAINAPIQGGAADIMKIAMIKTHKALKESGLDAKMLLQVHDELVVEASEKDAEATRTLIKQSMEEAVKLSTPLTVEADAGANWAVAH